MSTITEQIEKIVATITEQKQKFTLVYVEHDDKLSDDQIPEYVSTGTVASYWDSDRYQDQTHRSLEEEAGRLLAKFNVIDEDDERIEFDNLSDEDSRLLQDAISNLRDDDPLTELARKTTGLLFRVELAAGVQAKDIAEWEPEGEWDDPALHELESAGLPESAENVTKLRAMAVEQAYYGGDLVALFATDADTAYRLNQHGGTVADPFLFIWDGANGSCSPEGKFGETLTIKPGSLVLDSDGDHGYGLNSICGLVTRAFVSDLTVND